MSEEDNMSDPLLYNCQGRVEKPETLKADKIMTREEYLAAPLLKGWHGVCWDYDGAGSVGIKYDGRVAPRKASHPRSP